MCVYNSVWNFLSIVRDMQTGSTITNSSDYLLTLILHLWVVLFHSEYPSLKLWEGSISCLNKSWLDDWGLFHGLSNAVGSSLLLFGVLHAIMGDPAGLRKFLQGGLQSWKLYHFYTKTSKVISFSHFICFSQKESLLFFIPKWRT